MSRERKEQMGNKVLEEEGKEGQGASQALENETLVIMKYLTHAAL